MKVACKSKAFVQDQGHAVVRVARSGNDLSGDTDSCKEFPAVVEFQNKITALYNLNIREILSLEEIPKRCNETYLAFHQDQFYAKVFELLGQSGVVGMEMGEQQIFDLADGDPFAFQLRR